MTIAKGQVAELSARQLEIRLGLAEGELSGITILALPENGQLILDGVRVSEFSQLTREEIDRLCFVPADGALLSGFSFLPDGPTRATATLSVSVADQLPDPPQAQDFSFYTWSDIAVERSVPFEGEIQTATVHITRSPQKGAVRTDGQTISYQPFSGLWGEDQFSYVLIDAYGNLSPEATVSVTIQQNENGFVFADMAGRPEMAAAVTLHKNNILCGEKIGNDWYFHPDQPMTQGQFLLCLLAANNTVIPSTPVIRTSLDNDDAIPLWMKPYLQTAIDQKIIAEPVFSPDSVISVQQAQLLIRRAFSPLGQKAAAASLFAASGQTDPYNAAGPENQSQLTRAACAVLIAEKTNNFPS